MEKLCPLVLHFGTKEGSLARNLVYYGFTNLLDHFYTLKVYECL